MVGAAQPFFQCTPPLLSAQWFGSDERATSTAVALNFNQIGIATAFLVGGAIMATDPIGLEQYFGLVSVLCTIVAIGTVLQYQNLPPTPPSSSEMDLENTRHFFSFLVSCHHFLIAAKPFVTTSLSTGPVILLQGVSPYDSPL